MEFDLAEYQDFVLNYKSPDGRNVIGFFPEKRELVSGRESFWYWNGRILLDYGNPMDKLAKFILDYCEDNNIMPDYFVNVPEGVDKLTDYLNKILGKKLNSELGGKQVKMRANPKTGHGDPKDAYFIGPVEAGDKAVLLEDVTTTGGSVVKRLADCIEAKLNVLGTLCECNRMEKAAKGRKAERVDFDMSVSDYVASILDAGTVHYSLTDAEKILPVAFKLWTPPAGIKKAEIAAGLKAEFEDHGIVPMELEI